MIIADSDSWIDFWKRPRSATAKTLEGLIRSRQVLLIGVVLAELQRGFRNDGERRQANDMLEGLPYFEMHWDTWENAGAIAQDMDAKGMSCAITDACIAAAAIEGRHELLTRDEHFERIPGLKLYESEGDTDG